MMISFSSCIDNTEDLTTPKGEDTNSDFKELKAFYQDDIQNMKSELEKKGIEVPDIEEDESDARGIYNENPFVKAIKVTTKTLHPNRSGSYIDVSGVLLVPRKSWLTKYKSFRLAIVPPSTYTNNKAAPSNAFKNMSLVGDDDTVNFMYFWTLQAQTGYIVFIPDYPGFGESYGKCFHPYLDSKALVNSTIDLFKAAKKTLTDNGYKYKDDIVISGYSQGGFTAASLARELETNTAHNLNVKLLVTGGTPCNLKYIADVVRESDYTEHTYYLPYALWGYKQNAYPQINVNDVLLEPYASESKAYYDGTHDNLNDSFPHDPTELYTSKFLKNLDSDPSIAYLNQIIEENSVKPWKNKCKFIMTHGRSDDSVYYENAKDFADEQNDAGGNVTFLSTIGDHTVAFLPYFSKASFYLAFNK